MSLKEFRSEYLEQLLTFLWRQWSSLGVAGQSGAQDDWAIDPESLLVFSLGVARYDARLFDVIIDWLAINSEIMDTVRLRSIISELEEDCNKWSSESLDICINLRIVGSVMQYLSEHGNKRKWEKLADKCKDITSKLQIKSQRDVLFIEKTGKPFPLDESNLDPIFSKYSLHRNKIEANNNINKKAIEVPVTAKTNLRFLLRSFFGVGAKAECILYLLTHDAGRPREIAEAANFYWLSVQQVLVDMAKSKLIQTRTNNKKIEYWLSRNRWWKFISYEADENQIPKWLNWWPLFTAMSHLWNTLDIVTSDNMSEYMSSSKMQDSIEVIYKEFSQAGYDVPPPPEAGLPSDMYEDSALQFLRSIFKNSVISENKQIW